MEREHRLAAGAVELEAIALRTALYERIAARLQDLDRPANAVGMGRLRRLLAERLPLADYGPYSRSRDEIVAGVLAALDDAEG